MNNGRRQLFYYTTIIGLSRNRGGPIGNRIDEGQRANRYEVRVITGTIIGRNLPRMHGTRISEKVKIAINRTRCRELAWRHDGIDPTVSLKQDNRRMSDVANEGWWWVVQVEAVRIGGKHGCVQWMNASIKLRPVADDWIRTGHR